MATDDDTCEFRRSFDKKVAEILTKKRDDNNFFLSREQYNNVLKSVKETKVKKKKETKDYRRLARYDIFFVGDQEKLIKPLKDSKSTIQYYVTTDELFDIINDTHVSMGHVGRNRLMHELKNKYCNITKEAVVLYLSLCKHCSLKRSSEKKELVAKPSTSSHINSRGQLDLIDMQSQPCKDNRFIMVYQDHSTKFVMLRALTSKRPEEVAFNLLDVFTTIGAPVILQSYHCREFINSVITALKSIWKEIKIVQGEPRQGSVERTDRDVEDMLANWIGDNQTTDWDIGLKVIQFMKNRAYREDIKKSPHEAMFGCKVRIGLASSSLPIDVINKLNTEDDLIQVLNYEKPKVERMSTEDDKICIICSEQSSGVDFCIVCGGLGHRICGERGLDIEGSDGKVACNLCLRKKDVSVCRKSAREPFEVQAKKMKTMSDS